MGIEIFQVDAFADGPFTGNPAAVCPLEGPADAAWMQDVAMEMNLSETAFCWPEDDVLRLRWFTPAAEVDGIDFVSRFFAPGVGIDEDPVTGSAHCSLATYWASQLGRDELVGYQASARGGRVQVRLDGERVAIGGRAVTVLRGSLLV